MKKKSPSRKRAVKPRTGSKTVEEYLEGIPEPARCTLEKVRSAIRSMVPPEAIEIISYGIPAFKHRKILVWYAAFSKHCSLFPGSSVIEAFKKDLKGYVISKGTIQFPVDQPLPAALVRRMVKARLAANENKKSRT